MGDELSPDEFGAAVSVALALCPEGQAITAWGEHHAARLAAIRETNPDHYRAARAAYARRLDELRGPPNDRSRQD